METLTAYELRAHGEEHYRAVAATEDIDQFCSSLDWILPAHEAFIPDHPLHLRRSSAGFVTLARGFNPRIGRYLQPLEASWCLACPFVGNDVGAVVGGFAESCETTLRDWDLLYLSGIPQDSEIFRSVLRNFHERHRIGLGHKTRRYVASLDGGLDGWMGRRSSKFRSNMRRADRARTDEGVTYEYLSTFEKDFDAEALYDRVLRVEEKSWKGKSGTGILDGGMNTFYRIMLPRLARRGNLRVLFARLDGQDIAYVFGGVFGDTYRGLQLSYDDDYGSLSPGNLVQYEIISRLCEEGTRWYDLGSELDYKSRWAESRLETITMWVWRD